MFEDRYSGHREQLCDFSRGESMIEELDEIG